MADMSTPEKKASGGRCPHCGNPTERAFRPFCSKRCAEVDLHRWLAGSYSIPVVEHDDLPMDDEES
jgi:uncharacterized protein